MPGNINDTDILNKGVNTVKSVKHVYLICMFCKEKIRTEAMNVHLYTTHLNDTTRGFNNNI